MSKFKVGDKIRKKGGGLFSNGKAIMTVDRIEQDQVWIKETKTWFNRNTTDYIVVESEHCITLDDIVPEGYRAVAWRAALEGEQFVGLIGSSILTSRSNQRRTRVIIIEPIETAATRQRNARLDAIKDEIEHHSSCINHTNDKIKKLEEEAVCLTRNS